MLDVCISSLIFEQTHKQHRYPLMVNGCTRVFQGVNLWIHFVFKAIQWHC